MMFEFQNFQHCVMASSIVLIIQFLRDELFPLFLHIPFVIWFQVLFDEFGCLKKYNNTLEIIKDFYKIRHQKYIERKNFLTGMLEAEASRLENQARFILEKIEGKIIIGQCLS